MITYADIQRIYRLEKNSSNLQVIPENFYSELKILLSQLPEEHQSYIKKLASEIYESRKRKILMQAMRKGDTLENSITSEKELYNELIRLLKDYENKQFQEDIATLEEEKKETEKIVETIDKKQEFKEEEEESEKGASKQEMIKLKILKPLPSIVAQNSISYGPFSENMEVTLPEKIAKILLDKEVAEKIE